MTSIPRKFPSAIWQKACDEEVLARQKPLMAVARMARKEEGNPGLMTLSANELWYAVQVRTRWEASTAVLLTGKGYETFLPTYNNRKRAGGLHKEGKSPLFPGYVFCQFDAQKRLPILVTPGVIAVVGRGRIPLPVDENEICAIRNLVSSGLRAEPWPYLEVGQRVRIESDSLQGLEGILVQVKGNQRIVVSVTLLRRSVALEIDSASVRPLRSGRDTRPEGLIVHSRLQGANA